MMPFQCDWCLFRMLTGHIPGPPKRQDDFLLCLLWRCNLDTFWGREENTVLANWHNLDQLIWLWNEQVGLQHTLPQLGPFSHQDVFSVTVAIGMLLKSLQLECYQSYRQFETMRGGCAQHTPTITTLLPKVQWQWWLWGETPQRPYCQLAQCNPCGLNILLKDACEERDKKSIRT